MTKPSRIKKVVASTVLAGAFALTSLAGGIASADTPALSEIVVTKDLDCARTELMVMVSPTIRRAGNSGAGVGELQECTPIKAADASMESRDFLIWQRHLGSTSSQASTYDTHELEEVSLTYQRIDHEW